jgi:hypothetical protein
VLVGRKSGLLSLMICKPDTSTVSVAQLLLVYRVCAATAQTSSQWPKRDSKFACQQLARSASRHYSLAYEADQKAKVDVMKSARVDNEITKVLPKRTISGMQMRSVRPGEYKWEEFDPTCSPLRGSSNPDLTQVEPVIDLDVIELEDLDIDDIDFATLGLDEIESEIEFDMEADENSVILQSPPKTISSLNIEALLKSEFTSTPEHKQVQSIINKWTYDTLTVRAKAQFAAARIIIKRLRQEKQRRTISLEVFSHALSEVVALRRQAKAFIAFRNKTQFMNR